VILRACLLSKPKAQIADIEEILPQLRAMYNINPTKPFIRFYEGTEGVRTVTNDLLTVTTGAYYYFGSMDIQFGVEGREHAKEFVLQRVSRGIKSYSIRDRQTEVRDELFLPSEHLLRYVRYFPRSAPAAGILNIYVYDGRVAIISSLQEQYALVIESREFFEMCKFIWSLVWDISRE